MLLCALLLAGCSADEPSTPVVEPTVSIEVSTPVVGVTRAPAPTATRPSTAATRPAATATPSNALSFSFGAGVDAGDRAIITNVVEASRKVVAAGGAVQAPCTVLAFDTLPALSQAYARLGGSQAARGPDVVRRLQNGVAEAGYRNVAIYTKGTFWPGATAVQRAQAVAHEYVHVVQLELVGEQLANQTFTTASDKVPPGGPFWLLEGSAELLSWAIIEDIRLGSLDAKLADYRQQASTGHVRLDEMENYIGYIGGGTPGIATATLGASALLQDRPVDDLFRFWGLIRGGMAWPNAFSAAFGMSLGEFYAKFEALR